MGKKVTMKDIAGRLDISTNAVSLALNDKAGISKDLQIKILSTANEMGYIGKKTKYMRTLIRSNLCVMMQNMYADDLSFYGKVLYSIMEEARKNGFDARLNFFYDDDFSVPHFLLERRVAGVIVIGKILDVNLLKLLGCNLPVVMVDHASLSISSNSIVSDNKLGGFIATKYLIDKGYGKIGFFGDLDYSLSIKERFFGFSEAISKLGGVKGDIYSYIMQYSFTKNIEMAVLHRENQKIVDLLRDSQRLPDAFVCSNDKAAISLLTALQSIGYNIPQDISIIGFDNIDMCERIIPHLTTVDVNKENMAKLAVKKIKHLIEHPDSIQETTMMSVRLVERDSVRQ